MPQSPKELERIGEEASEHDERFELEDTAVDNNNNNNNAPPPELLGRSQIIALRSALNMATSSSSSSHDFHTSSSTRDLPTPDPTPYSETPLPLSPPEVWKGCKTLAARRRYRNRSSLRSLNLTKPLAGMGDSLNWKLSVLHRFNAIKYTS